MDASITSAIAVDRLVKLYKGATAVDGISFRLPPGSITGLLGGNGAGKTTTIAMIMGLVTPTSGTVTVLGAQMPKRALPRAAPDEFRKPLCRHADAAHRAAESVGVRAALRGRRYRRAHRQPRRRSRTDRIPRPADRQAVGRAEDPRLARQGAAQPPGSAAARRADRLARSRHRRLGARPARALSPRARRHRAARLAQHDRGRAAVRARHHHEEGPHRGRRHARSACSPATAARRWKKCFSTSRAGAATHREAAQ